MSMTVFAGVMALATSAAPAVTESLDDAAEKDAASAEATELSKPASPFDKAEIVEEQQLASIAGREDITQLTNADQTNAVTGNEVGDNSVTGQISISDRAFSNTNGFVVLNANTGNNVAINASIQVNVALPND